MLLLLAGGCLGPPELDAAADPLVVTEAGAPDTAGEMSPERAAAITEMRAKAAAAETTGYPDVFQSAQTGRLARREEPRPVSGADAIELELAALARQRGRATTPGEIATLEARAAELRRLGAQAQAASLRP